MCPYGVCPWASLSVLVITGRGFHDRICVFRRDDLFITELHQRLSTAGVTKEIAVWVPKLSGMSVAFMEGPFPDMLVAAKVIHERAFPLYWFLTMVYQRTFSTAEELIPAILENLLMIPKLWQRKCTSAPLGAEYQPKIDLHVIGGRISQLSPWRISLSEPHSFRFWRWLAVVMTYTHTRNIFWVF